MKFLITGLYILLTSVVFASKLVEVKVVDKDYIVVFFQDGKVVYHEEEDDSELILFGEELNTTIAVNPATWIIKSSDDENYGPTGVRPISVFRKSKLTGLSQKEWDTEAKDHKFDWAYEHSVFLQLPESMVQGKTYTIDIDTKTNTDAVSSTFTYDIFANESDAVHLNIVGYSSYQSKKAADVYMWMGDGGARNYSSFEGNDVFIYNVESGEHQKAGKLSFWKESASETSSNHEMIRSDVWNADFTGFNTPGKYRLVVDGIGCSEEFEIAGDIYAVPFRVNTLGFYYMRIGEDQPDMVPPPRRPLYIPGISPPDTKVYITTMHPYHPEWKSFAGGDKWDRKKEWEPYSTGRTNPNAYGGHSDAADWDRHLGHVSIVYDLLFPYFITNGVLSEDNLGIAESGNGIPDVIDEARNEVDFWLRLRDGQGYSHGLNNPNANNVFYQAGNTAIAAWANAVNAAMLSNCFLISGHNKLMEQYRDSAVAAYSYANALPDQMLDKSQGIGVGQMRGRDFKATAAAFLYNITGKAEYENDLNELSSCISESATVQNKDQNQVYAVAGYLFSKQDINYPVLYKNMKSSLIAEAKSKEAVYSTIRPSRRATDNENGWYVTMLQVQRTIIAHAIADSKADKALFEDAMILEADWSLGRNPLNMIQMTTATTALEEKNSVPNAYTSGWDDGIPGVHPGHTPYMNIYDWGGGIRGNPSWMTAKNYPDVSSWPYGEMYYDIRYVWAANEFTPQQTMRGKQALYSYLYALEKKRNNESN